MNTTKTKTVVEITHWNKTWSTYQEIKFLKGLGKYTGQRLLCLQNYLEPMPLRHNWGDIDPVKIRDVVVEMIVTEQVNRGNDVPIR